jgi:hypothetical protein
MIAAPVIPFGQIDEFPANARRPRQARELAHPAGDLAMMIAVGKRGRRFARRDQARSAHKPRFRSSPAPINAVQSSARLAGSGTAFAVTVSVAL